MKGPAGQRSTDVAALLAAVALSLAIYHSAPAAEEIDPEACFCLQHDSGQAQRGCRAVKASADEVTIADCKDPDSGQLFQTEIRAPWTVILDGNPGCELCRPQSRGPDDVIRGENDD